MPMNFCPSCEKEYAPHSAMCPPCNYWFTAPVASFMESAESGVNKRQLMAFGGGALLVAGLFTPLVGVPFFNVNYYTLTQFSGLAGFGFFLLLLCGGGSIALGTTKRYESLKWPGFTSLLIIASTFFIIRSKIAEATRQMETSLASSPETANGQFKQMGAAFMGMIQMQWGWGVLAAGAVLLIVAGLMKDE